jgi:hypothetical protein
MGASESCDHHNMRDPRIQQASSTDRLTNLTLALGTMGCRNDAVHSAQNFDQGAFYPLKPTAAKEGKKGDLIETNGPGDLEFFAPKASLAKASPSVVLDINPMGITC